MKNFKKLGSFIAAMLLILVTVFIMSSSTGCDVSSETTPSSYDTGAKATEDAVQGLVNNDTLPKVTKSLERENLKRRIEFVNQPDRIGYLYLLSQNGQLIREVQVLGKVSSLNSYLTPMEEVKKIEGLDLGDSYGDAVVTVQAPDLDGTYGENDKGIFWFTPDGVYQEWSGLYLYSSERLTFTTQPLLIEQAKSN